MATAEEYKRQLGGMTAANRRLRQRNDELLDFMQTLYGDLSEEKQVEHMERYVKLLGRVK